MEYYLEKRLICEFFYANCLNVYVHLYKIMVMAKGKGWRPKQRKQFNVSRENKDRLIFYLLLNCFNHTIMTFYLSIGLLSLFA